MDCADFRAKVSSDTYEYDLCLSKFIEAEKSVRGTFEQHGKEPAAEFRPRRALFERCQNTKHHVDEYTDAVIDEICTRWQQTRLLRELYQDPAVFAEFEDFRRHFLTARTAGDTFRIVSPGLHYTISTAQGFGGAGASDRDGSSANFHKTLCLHSLAIATRTLAKTTKLNTINDSKRNIEEIAVSAWAKKELPGVYSGLCLRLQIQSLETWDFMYHFLL